MNNLPIYIFNIGEHPNKSSMAQSAIFEHAKYVYAQGNSFPLKSNRESFDELYRNLLEISEDLFDGLRLLENNKRTCWAYLTNRDFYRGGIHDHMRTSVINAVYYLQVPKTKSYKEGGISFYDEENNEVFCFKPRAGDLVIFPNHLKHQPHQSHTDDFRIAINMEIMCEPVNWK